MVANDGGQASQQEKTTGAVVEEPVAGTAEERLRTLGVANLKGASSEVVATKLHAWAQDYYSVSSELERQLLFDLTAKMLDGVLKAPARKLNAVLKDHAPPRDSGASEGNPDDQMLFEEPEPWDSEVDGKELLDQLANTITKYVFLPPGASDTLALWALFTYAWGAFDIYPYINVTSVVWGCGKSTLAEVMNSLVYRPLKCEHATGPALFRTIEQFGPTCIIDEADSFLDRNEEMRGLVNSGHRRGGGFIRCIGDDNAPHKFSTVGPKIILGIGRRAGTVIDRSINFDLQRKTEVDEVERIVSIVQMDKGLLRHRRKMKRWADDHLPLLEGSDPDMPSLRADRALDNWRPLFAIAKQVGGSWPERVQEASLAIDGKGNANEEENVKIRLVHDVDRIFEAGGKWPPPQNPIPKSVLRSEHICKALAEMDDRPWPEWSNGKPISQTALARQLKGFKIKPKSMRFDANTFSGYKRDWLKDTLNRYPAPDKAQQPQQSSNDGDKGGDPTHNTNLDVVTPKTRETPHEASTVAGVVDGVQGGTKEPRTFMSSLDVPNEGDGGFIT